MKIEEIERIFTYHAPIGDQAERYGKIRELAKDLALVLNLLCPESREKSLALTSLQQTVMWANASIAIHDLPAHPPPLDRGK